MPERIGYAGSVAVVGGPTINFNSELKVDDYEKHTKTVPKGGATTVSISLGDTTNIQLLVVTASQYDPTKLTYTLKPDATLRDLDQPFFLAGGVLTVLGSAGVTDLVFKNNLPTDVTVSVFIARSV